VRQSPLTSGSIESLLGIEGYAAKIYFEHFAKMLKNETAFAFEKRNRRPPRDPVNALLSLAYSLLAKDFSIALTVAGLEPLLGFYHQPRAGRPSLALDLMEEFRPIIADSVVVTAINTGVVSQSDFVTQGDASALTASGRRNFIQAYERRMQQEITHPAFGYKVSYRRVLEVQARLLSRSILGEIADYPQFLTR
jgi:CRISPR-associated protein Cas1